MTALGGRNGAAHHKEASGSEASESEASGEASGSSSGSDLQASGAAPFEWMAPDGAEWMAPDVPRVDGPRWPLTIGRRRLSAAAEEVPPPFGS